MSISATTPDHAVLSLKDNAQHDRPSVEQQDNLQRLLTQNICPQCNLEGLDLSRSDLIGAILERANLSNTNLQDTDLVGANLSYATLVNANLQGADLESAVLIGAVLEGANLQNANLCDAILPNGDFGEC